MVLESDDVVLIHRFPDLFHRILGCPGIIQEIPAGNGPDEDCQDCPQGDPFLLPVPGLCLRLFCLLEI